MNRAHNQSPQAGFTLVELTLSMAFLSMLLLGIAMLTMQISSTYNKGLTIRAVNESGQSISSDIQRKLNNSQPAGNVFVEDAAKGGRLCTGDAVYGWNYGKASGADRFNTYTNDSNRDIRLVRFNGDVTYCMINAATGNYPTLNSTTLTNLSDLLTAGDSNLALHQFTIKKDVAGVLGQQVTGDDTQRMYEVSFTIGTSEQSIKSGIIAANGCQVPDSQTEDEYCAVNEFNFIARAGNKGE